jgi:very-short-patch-repair endonuclease
LGGWRFRRQHVIAGYVVDFYCPALWLAVEVDGSVHVGREEEDARRDDALSALGVRIHRVSNDDVIDRLPSVRTQLALRCAAIAHDLASSPAPSPHSDGGKAGLGGSRGASSKD